MSKGGAWEETSGEEYRRKHKRLDSPARLWYLISVRAACRPVD
nr:MAG TPA: hypothetical protein [Caudoviricetes sp.]